MTVSTPSSNDTPTLPSVVTEQVGEVVLTFPESNDEATLLLREEGEDAEKTRRMVVEQSRKRAEAFENW